MPYRAVIRNSNVMTKTVIVFDASSSDMGNLPLYDCMYSGNILNPHIFHLLVNFRLHKIGILADVEKVFLQISLSTKDRDAVRYFFIENTWNGEIFNLRKIMTNRFKSSVGRV